ncbi:MAG: hypothetical protein M1153_01700 [Patescibacteria group bacterium]|nr:hypothetical protein [Patescibacteria group bacterium]
MPSVTPIANPAQNVPGRLSFRQEWVPALKTIFVAAAPIGLGAWCGSLFTHGEFGYSLLATLAFVVFFTLQSILVANISFVSLLAVLDAFSFAPFIYQSLFSSRYVLGAFAVLLIFLVFGARATKSHFKSSVKIVFSRIASHSIDAAVMGLAIFLSTVYFFGGVYRFSPQSISGFMEPVASSVAYYNPNFNLATSTQSFLKQVVQSRLPSNIPIVSREAITNQLVSQVNAQLENYAGSNIDLSKTPVQNISIILADKISALSSKTKIALNVILVIAILLSVKSVSFIIYPIISLLAYLIFQILLAFNFAFMRYTQTSKESVSLEKGD